MDPEEKIERLYENIVELWHQCDYSKKHLHEWMDMTWEEYEAWVEQRKEDGKS